MADWSLLPTDLLVLIAGCFQTSFEIVLFRSVCSSWRSVVPSPRDSRCLGTKTHIPMFTSLHYRGKPRFGSDKKYCTLKKIPIYLVRFNTPFGDDYLLAEIHERKSGKPMRLLSPLSYDGLTSKETLLSFNSLTTQIVLLYYQYEINLEYMISFSLRVGVKWDKTFKRVEYLELNTDDCRDFRLLANTENGDIMIFRSLEMRWTKILVSPKKCRDMVSFKGKFYVVDTSGRGHVFVVEPSLEVFEIPSVTWSTLKSTKEALVKSGEELLLVQRFTPGQSHADDMYTFFPQGESHPEHMYTWFRVFRLDEEGGTRKWVQVDDLNDRVIFLGTETNICCSVQNLPGAKENCIVFIDLRNGIIKQYESILLFDLKTKSTSTAFSECRGYMGAFGANLESLVSCGVMTMPNPTTSIYDLLSDSIWLTKK
ncbi:putative F-box protein At2g16290 [Capsella rubella]|uniref:putative F-box protein At2g16290 n=1 Tax=Capsella rubella TaxID=81985 RepID=UPI000CD4EFA5|nr:putative F-box protein At2g16290 [Capsella rubella]